MTTAAENGRGPALWALCGWLVTALGVTTLAGWQLDIGVLRSLLPDAPPTTPLTSLMLMALAVALMASGAGLTDRTAPPRTWVCRGLSGAVVVLGLWILVEYALSLGPGLETFIYPRRVTELGGAFPGRPSPRASVNAVLLGAAIFLSPRSTRRTRRAVGLLGMLGMALPWLAVFGYASAITPFYEYPMNPQTGVSPLTAVSFLLLGVGVLGLRPREGVIGLMLMPSPAGRLLRRLLPSALIVPLLFGWMLAYVRDVDAIDATVGLALSWGITSMLFAALVIWQATVLHGYEARMRGQATALARSNRELQQFAYVASHDLQAPLRSISGFTQLLQETYQDRLDDAGKDWITRTVHSVHQMQAMIRDILAYSRVDASPVPFEPVNLEDVYGEVTERMAASIRDTGAVVTKGPLPTVQGDRTQLGQLLQNLVGNALEYRADRPPRVHVWATREPGEWVLRVQDNGIGIAPHHQTRIFEVFRRLHSHDVHPGTGIGLAICRRVAERHGGRLWVTSALGQGSTFLVGFPDRDPLDDDSETAPMPSGLGGAASPDGHAARGPTPGFTR